MLLLQEKVTWTKIIYPLCLVLFYNNHINSQTLNATISYELHQLVIPGLAHAPPIEMLSVCTNPVRSRLKWAD